MKKKVVRVGDHCQGEDETTVANRGFSAYRTSSPRDWIFPLVANLCDRYSLPRAIPQSILTGCQYRDSGWKDPPGGRHCEANNLICAASRRKSLLRTLPRHYLICLLAVTKAEISPFIGKLCRRAIPGTRMKGAFARSSTRVSSIQKPHGMSSEC